MAEFLTTTAVSYQIDQILITAEREVVLISPFLKLSRTLVQRLQDCERRDVALRIVYGKSDLKDDQRGVLSALKNLELSFLENLHAKCYYNERRLVISSMNMYEFSEVHNREMGILLTSDADPKTFAEARREAESILQAAAVELGGNGGSRLIATVIGKQRAESTGRCIRCGAPRNIDPARPLCHGCYSVWSQYGDPYYMEVYCHMCGKKAETSVAKPLCGRCFRQVGCL